MRVAELRNAWWLAFGPLVQASDGPLVVGEITVAPVIPQTFEGLSADAFLGVTTGLMRLISPSWILGRSVGILRSSQYRLEVNQRLGLPAMGDVQRAAFERIKAGSPRNTRASRDQIAAIAERYVTLYRFGAKKLLPQIANEFGLTSRFEIASSALANSATWRKLTSPAARAANPDRRCWLTGIHRSERRERWLDRQLVKCSN